MKVLFVSSECAPIAKVGGLGDVIESLPKALKELGLDVRIVIPKYSIIEEKKYHFDLITKDIRFKGETINIYKGFLPASQVPIYLLENEKYFSEDGVYFEEIGLAGSFEEIRRFLFFSQAILEIFPNLNWQPDIIHCHDWHTAIVPLLLNTKYQIPNTKTLLTIHNLANQGKWQSKEVLNFLNLKGDEVESLKIKDTEGNLNILQQGILNADLINTVSSNYSKEILTKEYGEGLENYLLERKNDTLGILNGIDEEVFNPETDSNLKMNYFWKNLENKLENKLELQEILDFKKDTKIPLFTFIGRLTPQKGIDLIIKIIPELVKMDCQFVFLGVGMENYEKKLLELSQKYPQNISAQIKFDPVLAQKIYGGADIFLMPSRFEPCGLGQMIAMRYGTIPIARQTGGLTDTIENKKTGFLFKEYKVEAFLETIKTALNLYQGKKAWQKLVKEAMKKDFSWKKSAREYLKLYQILTLD